MIPGVVRRGVGQGGALRCGVAWGRVARCGAAPLGWSRLREGHAGHGDTPGTSPRCSSGSGKAASRCWTARAGGLGGKPALRWRAAGSCSSWEVTEAPAQLGVGARWGELMERRKKQNKKGLDSSINTTWLCPGWPRPSLLVHRDPPPPWDAAGRRRSQHGPLSQTGLGLQRETVRWTKENFKHIRNTLKGTLGDVELRDPSARLQSAAQAAPSLSPQNPPVQGPLWLLRCSSDSETGINSFS